MKYIRTVLFSALFVLFGAAPVFAAGAFGLELGADLSGYEHGAQPVSERWQLKMYEVTPPSPDSRFDTYAVDTFQGRIIRIMASSPDDPSENGASTLGVLESLKDELVKKYGEPSLNLEDIEELCRGRERCGQARGSVRFSCRLRDGCRQADFLLYLVP